MLNQIRPRCILLCWYKKIPLQSWSSISYDTTDCFCTQITNSLQLWLKPQSGAFYVKEITKYFPLGNFPTLLKTEVNCNVQTLTEKQARIMWHLCGSHKQLQPFLSGQRVDFPQLLKTQISQGRWKIMSVWRQTFGRQFIWLINVVLKHHFGLLLELWQTLLRFEK